MNTNEKYTESQELIVQELKNHIDRLLIKISELENENAVLKEEIIELQKGNLRYEPLAMSMRITT